MRDLIQESARVLRGEAQELNEALAEPLGIKTRMRVAMPLKAAAKKIPEGNAKPFYVFIDANDKLHTMNAYGSKASVWLDKRHLKSVQQEIAKSRSSKELAAWMNDSAVDGKSAVTHGTWEPIDPNANVAS